MSTIPAAAQTPDLVERCAGVPVVFEVVYHPWPTPLAASVTPDQFLVTGLDLLVHQATLQFHLFTGTPAADAPRSDARRPGLSCASGTVESCLLDDRVAPSGQSSRASGTRVPPPLPFLGGCQRGANTCDPLRDRLVRERRLVHDDDGPSMRLEPRHGAPRLPSCPPESCGTPRRRTRRRSSRAGMRGRAETSGCLPPPPTSSPLARAAPGRASRDAPRTRRSTPPDHPPEPRAPAAERRRADERTVVGGTADRGRICRMRAPRRPSRPVHPAGAGSIPSRGWCAGEW